MKALQSLGEEVDRREILLDIYHRLFTHYGPQHWWPADGPWEVMVGAILTQSAAWTNVEKAIASLKAASALSPAEIRRLPIPELARLIYPSGYYNAKALKLKSLSEWLGEHYADNPAKLFEIDIHRLRPELLSVYGIGQETAVSIILSAAEKPIFVIDAYTSRIILRLGCAPLAYSYPAFQALFMDNLPSEVRLFNEYHALFVRHGKEVCKRLPLCGQCCLRPLCGL